jgi:hypothetical protein
MKIIFAKSDEHLICKKCKTPIIISNEWSDDGQLDDNWCEKCIDFKDVLIVKNDT